MQQPNFQLYMQKYVIANAGHSTLISTASVTAVQGMSLALGTLVKPTDLLKMACFLTMARHYFVRLCKARTHVPLPLYL